MDILKRARPDVRLAVMVEDRYSAIFEGNPDVDQLLPPFGELRWWRPQLCLNLHGGTRSALITAASGARFRAGFGHFRHQFIYNVRIPRAQQILGVERKVHTAEHLASAMFYLGAPLGEVPRARLVAGQAEPRSARLAVIHAVAATREKAWHAGGFLRVAEHLKETGMEPVFIAGAGDDLSAFAAFRTIRGAPLDKIKTLLANAALFVGNDSGPAHMASAFGVPCVVVFGASDPGIWGPWRTESDIVTAPGGIERVEPAQVLDALERLRMRV